MIPVIKFFCLGDYQLSSWDGPTGKQLGQVISREDLLVVVGPSLLMELEGEIADFGGAIIRGLRLKERLAKSRKSSSSEA